MIAGVVDMRELFVKERAEVVSFSLILQTRYLTGILVQKTILDKPFVLLFFSNRQERWLGWLLVLMDVLMASGQGTLFLNQPSGIYIVQQGNQARKSCRE